MTFFWPPARQVKVLRPLYGAEVFDGETARFEVELSEDDVHGQWKLNGQVLNPTAVRSPQTSRAGGVLVVPGCSVHFQRRRGCSRQTAENGPNSSQVPVARLALRTHIACVTWSES